ncbi:transposase [Ameyamaea chiangmaiensis NBRC 103196]|nr:transposase [Ameyamaea chiangmaiensis NBRC 103196]
MTDAAWARIVPLVPEAGRTGLPSEVAFREVMNAVRSLVRSCDGGRRVPIHFRPWTWFIQGIGPAVCVPDHS